MALTIREYIKRLAEYPDDYTAEAYQGEANGLRVENDEGEQVGFIEDY